MHKRQDEIDSKIEDLSTNINTCNEKLEAQAERISELPTVITEKFVEMFEDKVVIQLLTEYRIVFTLSSS
jgi:chaperonin cofactor prefoldin